MSDSTTNLDLVVDQQATKDVAVDELISAAGPATTLGDHIPASVGFSFAVYGGKILIDGTPTSIANQVLDLTSHPSTTVYIYLTAAGSITVTTSIPTNWPGPLDDSATALYTVTTNGSGVTGWTDWRIGIVQATALGGVYVDLDSPPVTYLKLTAPNGKVFYIGPFETP